MSGRVVGAIVLTGVYLLVLGDPVLLDVPIGLAVAVLAMAAIGGSPLQHTHEGRSSFGVRVGAVVVLGAETVRQVAAGTVRVATAVLGLRPPRTAGVVRVDIGPCTERTVVFTGVLLTVSPGSILVEASHERGHLDVHVVDADDPSAVCADVQRLHDLVVRVMGI